MPKGVYERVRRVAVGEKYGFLTIESLDINVGCKNRNVCTCVCVCGNKCVRRDSRLLDGSTVSCGCKIGTAITHGMSYSSEYRIWLGIRERCCNGNSKDYLKYGLRGIGICDDWNESFESFFSYVGPRPSMSHSIGRIDNDGNYEPGNVEWQLPKIQCRNRRGNKFITYQNKTLTIAEWSEITGINYITLCGRLLRGFSVERALTEPVKHKNKNKAK